jgi:hypothetical protein
MWLYTTCRDCGGTLHTTDGDTVHPLCNPQPTRTEQLTHEWLQLIEANQEFELDCATILENRILELDNQPPRLQAAALTYASWGWPVFPLKPLSKVPATRRGFKDATLHPDQIRAWWTRQPDSNIGLPTGHAFDVIDIDPPQGWHSLTQLLSEEDPHTGRGDLPDAHGQVATASGGAHYYVKPIPGRGNTVHILPGIDYRGAGGYVVAPPSTLGQPGRQWSWTTHPSPQIKAQRRG